MKKVLLVLASIFIAVLSYAQTDISVEGLKGNYTDGQKFDINANKTYKFFYGSETADTVTNNDTIWYRNYIIENLYDAVKHELRIELDSVSGSPALNVALRGKYSYNDSYTSISNVDWAGTSSDTTIAISNGTAKNYRFLQVYIDAIGDSTQAVQVERIELGIYK